MMVMVMMMIMMIMVMMIIVILNVMIIMMMMMMVVVMMITIITRQERIQIKISVHMSYIVFFKSFLYPRPGSVGLDWETLYKTLNQDFNWEDAVQKALGSDDTLEEVLLPSKT